MSRDASISNQLQSAAPIAMAELKVAQETSGKLRLYLSGDWQLEGKATRCQQLEWPGNSQELHFDSSGLKTWDSSLLIFLRHLLTECQQRQIKVCRQELPEGCRRLLSLCEQAPFFEIEASVTLSGLASLLRWLDRSRESVLRVFTFIGELSLALLRLPFGRVRMRTRDFWRQLVSTGPWALGIVSLISFLMGVILAFIGAIPLKWFRAELYVASLVGIGIFRLMAPVMVGVVLSGRTGAAYAAELGSMQVNEETDALRTFGLVPMEFLILPRYLALTLMMPLLCVYADIVGVFGGMLVSIFYLKLSLMEFWNQFVSTTRCSDLSVGLFSSLVFGMLVSICGCYHGINCRRNTAGVGQATTDAVVSSIVCIVIATALITVITVLLGI